MAIIINLLCLVFLIILFFLLVVEIQKNHVFGIVKATIYEKRIKRKKAEEKKALEEGNQEDKESSIFYRLDLALLQSGIQKKMPFVTAEIFILILFVTAVISFIVSLIITGKVIFSLIAGALGLFLWYMAVTILLAVNNTHIEADIMKFVNLLENFSKTSDDIASIMKSVCPYLDEPLYSAVKEWCTEADVKGDMEVAFKRLELKVNHKQFSQLIQNIEMCSRYNMDYGAVVTKNRDVIRNYLSQKQVHKQMANSARINVLVLYISAGVVLRMLDNIGGDSVGVLNLLVTTTAGNILILAAAIITMYIAWQLITMGR